MTNIAGIDISILIVSFNTRELTLACLGSIFAETQGVSIEVIVLDNASQDNSATAIKNEFADVQVISSDVNIGFARANNVAAQEARGKYILLLNPDTVILEGAIQKIWNFAREYPGYQIYGGRTVFEDGELNPSSCWGMMTLWSVFCNTFGLRKIFPSSQLFDSEGYGGWKRDSVREVGVVTGCFLLISTEFWKELGGFGRHYFMYAEEADLCLRARALGARPVIFPDATIIHHGCASEPVEWERQTKVLKGKVTLMRDHWSSMHRAFGIGLLTCRALNHWVVYRAMSILTRSDAYRERAHTFSRIWKSRSDWKRGYYS